MCVQFIIDFPKNVLYGNLQLRQAYIHVSLYCSITCERIDLANKAQMPCIKLNIQYEYVWRVLSGSSISRLFPPHYPLSAQPNGLSLLPSLFTYGLNFLHIHMFPTFHLPFKGFCFLSIRSAEPLCGATALPSVGRVHYCLLFPFLLSQMESNTLYHNLVGWLGNNLMFFLLIVF